jgi:hypothetical protein
MDSLAERPSTTIRRKTTAIGAKANSVYPRFIRHVSRKSESPGARAAKAESVLSVRETQVKQRQTGFIFREKRQYW